MIGGAGWSEAGTKGCLSGKHGGWHGPIAGGAGTQGPKIGACTGGAGIRHGEWHGRGIHIGRHGGLGQGLHGTHTIGQGGGGGFFGGGGGGGGGLEQQQQQQQGGRGQIGRGQQMHDPGIVGGPHIDPGQQTEQHPGRSP